MRKLAFISILVLIVLSISACNTKTTGTDTTKTGASTNSFIGGTKGLDIKFMSGAPPDEVYDKDYPFDINIRLENVGESTVDSGRAIVTIMGISKGDFNIASLEKKVDTELLGAKLDPQGNAVAGGITNIEFNTLQAADMIGNMPFELRAQVCYPYTTTVISKLCILKDVLGKTRKAGEAPYCEPDRTFKEETDFENSGAPVHITDFKQVATGENKISFTFNIEHVGGGLIYDKSVSESERCSGASVANKDTVFVEIDTGISGTLSCSGITGTGSNGNVDGKVKLYSSSGAVTTDSKAVAGKESRSIVCSQDLPLDRSDYSKQISIKISYDYKDFAYTEFVVKDVGQ